MASNASGADSSGTKRPLADPKELQPNARQRLSEVAYTAGAASSSASSARHVLVRVDEGLYSPLHLPGVDIMHLDRSELLKAICRDDIFSEHMKGMALDLCSVTAVASHERKQPLREELAHAQLLEGVDTLADAIGMSPGNVFIHVTGPQAAATIGPMELTALRNAIATAQPVDSLISLSGGAEWPQLGAVPLFVRSFYDGCYAGPLQSLTPSRAATFRKFIILGNPGIGKSAFGCYLLYRAIREGRTVVYQSAKLNTAYVFHSHGGAREVKGNIYEDDTVLHLLKDHSTVFISDSITPKCVHAFTVLITSPKLERWSEYYKESDCERLFFSVFNWNEMLQLQATCFPGVDGGMAGMQERYARWGGIPRYVLAKTGKRAQKRLEAALSKPDYRLLADFLGKEELESEDAASHRLLHLKVQGEVDPDLTTTDMDYYDLARTELGSSYIADRVCEALMTSADNQLRSLLAMSPRPPSAAQLSGQVFERAALKILGAGGVFRIRMLQKDGKGTETDLLLPATTLPVAGFRTQEELAQLCLSPESSARVLRPTSKSFCAVDFVLQVLITSPKRERWSGFRQEPDCARLIVPVFTWDEIVQLQRGCFADIADGMDGVEDQFARWGGIPRYVLAKLDSEEQTELEAALTKPDCAQLAQFLGKGELESEAAASHRLLHLKVKGELDASLSPADKAFFSLARSELGSSYIADMICQAMLASADNQLRSLLSLSPRPPSVAKLYGAVFERFALKILIRGGTFRMRRLKSDGKGAEADLVLQPAAPLPEVGSRTVLELRTLAAVPANADRWFRPTSKSFCAIDFIMQGKRPANATVNLSHGLILRSHKDGSSGLLPVADALALTKPLDFYWIAPQTNFDEWKRPQPLIQVDMVVHESGTLQVNQYVVGIPFDATSMAS